MPEPSLIMEPPLPALVAMLGSAVVVMGYATTRSLRTSRWGGLVAHAGLILVLVPYFALLPSILVHSPVAASVGGTLVGVASIVSILVVSRIQRGENSRASGKDRGSAGGRDPGPSGTVSIGADPEMGDDADGDEADGDESWFAARRHEISRILRLGKVNDSRDLEKTLLRVGRNPTNPALHARLARIYEGRGDAERLLYHLYALVELAPRGPVHARALYDLARVLSEDRGEPEAARPVLKRLLRLYPTTYLPHDPLFRGQESRDL